jgi:hypothetical protein
LDVNQSSAIGLDIDNGEDAKMCMRIFYESFAWQRLKTPSDAIDKLNTDRVIQAANGLPPEVLHISIITILLAV